MNVHPFRRRERGTDGESSTEAALRRSLARHAFETPDADDLTRRILAAADEDTDDASATVTPLDRERRVTGAPSGDRGPWKTWGLPLVAAAAVVAVVGSVAAIASYNSGDGHSQQAATDHQPTAHATVTTPKTASPTSTATKRMRGTSGLSDVKVLDLTFYGTNDGVALTSAQCIGKPGATCTALLRTTDGTTWKPFGGNFNFQVPGVTTGCPATSCVDHIRFASKTVGYAYGPDAFYLTKDGGQNWTKQPGGGAAALETLAGNVIRVSTSSAGCPPGCSFAVQTAAIGSPNWTTVPLPGGSPTGDAVQLSRGGTNQHDAYLLVMQNPAGGSNDEKSTLYRSTNNGAHWSDLGEPCHQNGGEVDSYQVAAGSGGNVAVLCRTRDTGPYRVETSTDSGRNFTVQQPTFAAADVARIVGVESGAALPDVLTDSGTVLAVAGNGVSVSSDHGASFDPSPDLVGTFGSVGFESTTVGRAVSQDGTQIWTTDNVGRTWHESTP